jgi:uncharacterized protein YigE (DUF2233 family)
LIALLRALAASLVLGLALAPVAACARGDPPCYRERFDGSNFTVCRYDAARQDLRLVWTDPQGQPLRKLSRLAASPPAKGAPVRFAMNAGMFDEAGAPIGLYVEEGRERHPLNTREGPGNFHLKPNGVFSVDADGAVYVETTEAYRARPARAPSPRWATQSGPMLLVAGKLHPAIQPDGPSRNVRNGVGVADRQTAYFVISDGPVSFGRMARLFRDRLHCADALYLDGTVSSLWAPDLKRMDDSYALGPLVVVTDHSPVRR